MTLLLPPTTSQADFYNIVKYKLVDDYIRPIPFPSGQNQRTIIVMPGPSSAGHAHVYGPGLKYSFASRSGLGTYFWIDTFDKYENPRLTGGDQWNVAMVAPDKGSVYFARVTNIGNGSYYVGYNITVSGECAPTPSHTGNSNGLPVFGKMCAGACTLKCAAHCAPYREVLSLGNAQGLCGSRVLRRRKDCPPPRHNVAGKRPASMSRGLDEEEADRGDKGH